MLYISIALVACVALICKFGINISVLHKTDVPVTEVQELQDKIDNEFKNNPEYTFDSVLAEVHRILDAETEERD